MRGNRNAETKPEVALRSALFRRGLRFRKNVRAEKDVRCRVDVVFPREKVAVFVDGCFWHSCPKHGNRPSANSNYWHAKLARNVERDRENDRALLSAGWTVVRVWEHEPAANAAKRIEAIVRRHGVS